MASRGFESEGKGNTEWQQWSETEKDDIAIIMQKYGIGWNKLDTHKPHLSVLDYKKQERSREVKELEQELEDISVVIELKVERETRLDKEIYKQQLQLKKDCEEADEELARARDELARVRELRNELITQGDEDYYLKEEVIRLRYENQNLKDENKGLRQKLDKAYEFMRRFVVEGKSMLDKFLEWIGEKVRDVRGR